MRSRSRRGIMMKGKLDAAKSLDHSIVCLAYFFLFFVFKR